MNIILILLFIVIIGLILYFESITNHNYHTKYDKRDKEIIQDKANKSNIVAINPTKIKHGSKRPYHK